MSKPETSDAEIVNLLQSPGGMERGFRLLMDKYQERLYWHIRRMVLDHEDANDVIQNVLVKVFRSIGGFEGKSSLFTWLYRIATNETLTFLDRNSRRNTSSLEEAGLHASNRLRADVYFDGDEIQLRLREALEHLPEKQRVVFNLRYYEEMSYHDMSEVLSTSEGALKASFHHAVKKIEAYFQRYEIT